MRILTIFAIVVSMVTPLLAQNEDQAITDPQQITSRGKPDVQKFALDKLFMSYLVGGTAWSPDGKWIAFTSDHDGNEQWDVFLVRSGGGEVTNLTHTPEIAETDPAWSPDG